MKVRSVIKLDYYVGVEFADSISWAVKQVIEKHLIFFKRNFDLVILHEN